MSLVKSLIRKITFRNSTFITSIFVFGFFAEIVMEEGINWAWRTYNHGVQKLINLSFVSFFVCLCRSCGRTLSGSIASIDD